MHFTPIQYLTRAGSIPDMHISETALFVAPEERILPFWRFVTDFNEARQRFLAA